MDTNKSYDIYFTLALENSDTVWALIAAQGTQGQTNFPNFATTTSWGSIGFFRAVEGNDWDNDGCTNFMDAQPFNSAVSNLTITIDFPLNGANVQ